MDPFDFVVALVSIIIAPGVAELLVGIARILLGELELYRIHADWVFTLSVTQLGCCGSSLWSRGEEGVGLS